MPQVRRDCWKRFVKPNRLEALNALAACLRGNVPPAIDWMSAIAVANESLTTSNLAACVLDAGIAHNLPKDARAFLREVLARNGRRNQILLEQMSETILALNAAGITPLLLKGAAVLAGQPSIENAWRMVSDIDLLVKDDELALVITCLKSIGYTVSEQSAYDGGPITLARPSDVGTLDVHTRARGPAALRSDDVLYRSSLCASVGPAKVLLPSPTFQLLHFVLHDQFYGRDFWRGSVDLRHLCDLARIVSRSEIDWDFLRQLFVRRTSANAISSQMIQLNRLLGIAVPEYFLDNAMARFQYWRILTQMRYPFLRRPFICLTILLEWNQTNRDWVEYDVSFRRKILGRLQGAWRMLAITSVGKL
jgi:hypothetical protein